MVQKYKTLADMIALAEFAHRNQTDKAGLPYIEHPRRVMQAVQAQGALPYVQMAAILHDVSEDTAFTCDILRDLGVPEPALEIIRLVDRDHSSNIFAENNYGRDLAIGKNDQGRQWYTSLGPDAESEFYYTEIRKNPGALQVKLADIADNTQEYRLSYLSSETQARLRTKYAKARDLLTPNHWCGKGDCKEVHPHLHRDNT